ncbi:MAG: TetR/AcrR family transcriptional regulator [Prolixibacteraceae bacterium]|nr:TetR/AcrR family transcriptional regulator [Prolixibacteraceae bacterium]MBN2775871.1 TetR/AcrR family transcriptional regulator [Prolixibacteraceae bacterium]
MPLKTFHNLKKERKEQILRISYEEFVYNSYKTASVSNIVKRLQIAKGSFYRYFDSKLDLYTFLTKNAYYLRIQQLGILLENMSLDFFDILKENFRNKISFDIKHPLESIFLYNLMLETDTPEVTKLYDNIKSEAIKLTRDLIIQFQEKGKLNPELEPDMASHFIYQSQMGIYEYLAFNKKVNFKENIKKDQKLFELSEEEIMKVVDQIILIIRNGFEIKPR